MPYWIHTTSQGCILSDGMTTLYIVNTEDDFPNGYSQVISNTISRTYTVSGTGTTNGTSQNGERELQVTLYLAGCPQNIGLDLKSEVSFSTTSGTVYATTSIEGVFDGNQFVISETSNSNTSSSGSSLCEESVEIEYSGTCVKQLLATMNATWTRPSYDTDPIDLTWELSFTVTPNI